MERFSSVEIPLSKGCSVITDRDVISLTWLDSAGFVSKKERVCAHSEVSI